jgi:hypothetical protein
VIIKADIINNKPAVPSIKIRARNQFNEAVEDKIPE